MALAYPGTLSKCVTVSAFITLVFVIASAVLATSPDHEDGEKATSTPTSNSSTSPSASPSISNHSTAPKNKVREQCCHVSRQ